MGFDRRRVLFASLSMLFLAGCLDNGSLSEPFALRLTNRSDRPRRIVVTIRRVGDEQVYSETHELAAGEELVIESVVTTSGRYRILARDITDDEAQTAERNVELSDDGEFCGWFLVRAEEDGLLVSVPRCYPTNETEANASNESIALGGQS